jgi:5-methylcytosine-specific restriction endonuclease McrA
VRRAVWLRDGGCCQWPVLTGGVCGSQTRLEYDHAEPDSLGGASTIDNVRLLCRWHNQLAALEIFGGTFMMKFMRPKVKAAGP